MSNGQASDDSGRQKRTRFAAPSAPYEVTVLQTRGSPIAAARDHVNFHTVTLHDKLAKIFVRCAAELMTRCQNLRYRISSRKTLKTDYEYVPKSAQIKLEMAFERGMKEGEDFQYLYENNWQVIAECQLKLKSLVIESGDLNITEKKKLAFRSFVELVHDISEGFLTYDNRKYIDEHLCSIHIIELYSNHLVVHLDASK